MIFLSAPGKPASNIKILDERTDDGVVSIHISGVIKTEVTSIEEIMKFVSHSVIDMSYCHQAIYDVARWNV